MAARSLRAAGQPAQHATLITQAQTVLLRDLPALPLWEHVTVAALAPGVRAEFRWNGLPDYPRIARE